ncbi:MAG: hypothetical protein QW197_02725 [Candidatus Aenigmatarchaeota archaeon]
MFNLKLFLSNFNELIENLEKFYPIRGKNEKVVFRVLVEFLEKNNISYETQDFINIVPNGKSELVCDGLKIESLPSSFVSGKIGDKNLVSNILIREDFQEPNIAFNPYSREISLATFYSVPSITIRRSDVKRILEAENVRGKVKIKKEKFKSFNIIVGNFKNPKRLIFTHYDTVLNGAVDNSSGTAFLLSLLATFRDVMKENLFFICGSEELSYDKPYWGYGYRIAESEFEKFFETSKEIVVVDCIGFDKASFIEGDSFLKREAFPIKNFEKYENKIKVFSSISSKNIKEFYSFYHSNSDIKELLKEKYVIENFKKFVKLFRK